MSVTHGIRNPVLGDRPGGFCSIECACGWRAAGLESSAAAWSQLVHHLLDVLEASDPAPGGSMSPYPGEVDESRRPLPRDIRHPRGWVVRWQGQDVVIDLCRSEHSDSRGAVGVAMNLYRAERMAEAILAVVAEARAAAR